MECVLTGKEVCPTSMEGCSSSMENFSSCRRFRNMMANGDDQSLHTFLAGDSSVKTFSSRHNHNHPPWAKIVSVGGQNQEIRRMRWDEG